MKAFIYHIFIFYILKAFLFLVLFMLFNYRFNIYNFCLRFKRLASDPILFFYIELMRSLTVFGLGSLLAARLNLILLLLPSSKDLINRLEKFGVFFTNQLIKKLVIY